MSDTGAPYDKAIEESAKTAGKALDLARDGAGAISRPIANIYGLLIGDRIDAARERNLDSIARKTKKILADRDLAETAPLAEQIAIPLLEAARGEPRDEMQDLWAQLLANAMDPSRKDDVRPEFIEALRGFHPLDALVLRRLNDNYKNSWIPAIRLEPDFPMARGASIAVSLRNLQLSGCVEFNNGNYMIQPFGLELVVACAP